MKFALFVALVMIPVGPAAVSWPAQEMACGEVLQQQALNRCLARQAELVTQKLDSLIAELAPLLTKDEMRGLGDAQESWRLYRDKHCRWQARFFDGGSVQPTMHAGCLIDATWQRIDALKINLCEGHGMTGECQASRRYDRPRQ